MDSSLETRAEPSAADFAPTQAAPMLNRMIWVFSLLGILVAGYLWFMHAHPADIPCGPSHGCETVANSRYSQFPFGSGPPVAAWGTMGYLALTALAFTRTLPGSASRDRALLGLILLGAGVGTLASAYLTYLEIAVIHAICKWCMGSQTIIAVVFGCALVDFLARRSPMQNRAQQGNNAA